MSHTMLQRLPRILSGCLVLLALVASGLSQVHSQGQQAPGLPPFPVPQQDTTILLFPGIREAGRLDADRPSRQYLILAQARDQLVATATRGTMGSLVPRLRLLSTSGEQSGTALVDQGAAPGQVRATLKYAVTARGWYVLEVTREQDNTGGDYTLLLEGTAPDIYRLLPGGIPAWFAAADGTGILRAGSYPLDAGDSTLYVLVKAGQTLRLTLAGPGACHLDTTAPDGSTPVQQSASGSNKSAEMQLADTGWVPVKASVSGSSAVLTVAAVDSSGAAVTLAPDGLTGFVTVTPTPTPTATATPTPTLTPTITPTATETPLPTPTKVVITSLTVTRPESAAQVIATDTVWVFFNGFPELKAPGTRHLVSPPMYEGVYMMRLWWCAQTEAQRANSLPLLNVRFFVDGLQVDSSDILRFDRVNASNKYCRFWATQLMRPESPSAGCPTGYGRARARVTRLSR